MSHRAYRFVPNAGERRADILRHIFAIGGDVESSRDEPVGVEEERGVLALAKAGDWDGVRNYGVKGWS